MIKIVYDSLLGYGKKFALKIGVPAETIKEYKKDDAKVILLTRTFNYGEIPVITGKFMEKFHDKVIGIAVNGNQNWGENFGAAGNKLVDMYKIKNLLIYEGVGYPEDVEVIKTWIKEEEGNSI